MEYNKAKKMLIKDYSENVFNLSQFEQLNVDFPTTDSIINGATKHNVDEDSLIVILQLKDGLKFIINNDFNLFSRELITKINYEIGRKTVIDAGNFRTGTTGVRTKHSHFTFPVFDAEKYLFGLNMINNKLSDGLDKAINFIIFSIVSQPFWDGNKRTAFLAANAYLTTKNLGELFISTENQIEFNEMLSNYYENKNEQNFKSLYNTIKKNFKPANKVKPEKMNDLALKLDFIKAKED